MSLIPEECIEYDEVRKICVASEKGKVYTLNNVSNHKIRKAKVDKCFPQNEGEKRCDYLMSIHGENVLRIIFIELKGSGLTDALQQIFSTITYMKNELKNYQVDARIVGSRDVPGFTNTSQFKKLAREIYPGKIERSTNKFYSENI